MMNNPKILGLGTIVVDHQFVVEEYPASDTKVEATDARRQIGGPVPTALALLSRMGHSCCFAGIWGDDHEGRMIETDLRKEKIQTFEACCRTDLSTGIAQVWVEQSTGTRTIVCRRPQLSSQVVVELREVCPADHILHLDGGPSDLAIDLARSAKAHRQLVFLDAGSPKGRTDELLKFVDVLNVPRRFLQQFFESDDLNAGAKRLLDYGCQLVTITDGANGAWIYSPEGSYHQPAFPIIPIDTTGAGDVFTGGLIHAVLEQRPFEKILPFASAAAALKCTRWGNRSALPTLDEIESFLDQQN